MDGTIKFDYYYGIEAEQFSFYRVPRLLIKDARFKELSSDATTSSNAVNGIRDSTKQNSFCVIG
ncbi:hypothetical protein [Mediterraneibacter agrestimuris]|uniref:hypothetical protein n=1 Tax=Mediterraneibacter agrestimuris TaxID=2941333 RepID=UPI00203CD6FA|nr:hypothetical protein [Mediterraneibacter agrestimuris]